MTSLASDPAILQEDNNLETSPVDQNVCLVGREGSDGAASVGRRWDKTGCLFQAGTQSDALGPALESLMAPTAVFFLTFYFYYLL